MSNAYEPVLSRWQRMPVSEQMANIGSEVLRAERWRSKGNRMLSEKASVRALGLIDLSLASLKTFSQLKEFARLREAMVDYFYGSNQFSSSDILWEKYFNRFNYRARKSIT